jgi:hypothetical protein
MGSSDESALMLKMPYKLSLENEEAIGDHSTASDDKSESEDPSPIPFFGFNGGYSARTRTLRKTVRPISMRHQNTWAITC